jgi:hypothetical protein
MAFCSGAAIQVFPTFVHESLDGNEHLATTQIRSLASPVQSASQSLGSLCYLPMLLSLSSSLPSPSCILLSSHDEFLFDFWNKALSLSTLAHKLLPLRLLFSAILTPASHVFLMFFFSFQVSA